MWSVNLHFRPVGTTLGTYIKYVNCYQALIVVWSPSNVYLITVNLKSFLIYWLNSRFRNLKAHTSGIGRKIPITVKFQSLVWTMKWIDRLNWMIQNLHIFSQFILVLSLKALLRHLPHVVIRVRHTCPQVWTIKVIHRYFTCMC